MALLMALAGCSGGAPAGPGRRLVGTPPRAPCAEPTTAAEVDVPADRACFALVFDDALAPTNASTGRSTAPTSTPR